MQESQYIEWKSKWRDEYLKWICGFANSQGGKIFIGIDDKGRVLGIENGKRLLEDIPNKIHTQLGILCDVNLIEKEDKKYVVIEVNKYDVPITYHGKYYFRSGSTNKLLQGNSLNNFLLSKTGKTWGDVLEPRAKIDDIDLEAIEAFKNSAFETKRMQFIKEDSKVENVLEKLLLSENNKLKRSAILIFGKSPSMFYINAYIKIGKFDKTGDELKYQEIIEGNAFQLIYKTLEILDKKFLISPISYKGVHRVEGWEYPYEALREAIINAIVHKDYFGAPIQISVYRNKLVIWNEGNLPNDLNIGDLKVEHLSRPRNPILANTFFKGGLIEAWGRGTLKIFKECKKAGLPEPKIEAVSGGIKVTLFKNLLSIDKLTELGLNVRQVKIVEYLQNEGIVTNSTYRELYNVSEKTAYRDLEKLTQLEILRKEGEKKGTVYVLNVR